MVLKIGFIGSGGIARYHMERLAKMPDVQIAATCDVVEERAKEAANLYRAKAYTDFHEMLDREDLGAVWVAIPPFAHTDEVSYAAKKGVHVFIEKPIALTMEKAREMQRDTEKAKIKTWVGYHWRQSQAIRRAKALLEQEGGPIGMVAGYFWSGIPGGPDHWWRRRELSGGQVIEQSTHIFDLCRFLVGEVDRVYAEFATLLNADKPNFTVEDVSVVTLRFKNGAIGFVTSTSGAKPKGGFAGLRLLARNLQLNAEGTAVVHVFKDKESMDLVSENDPYFDENRKSVDAIAKDLPTEVPISEGVKSLELSVAAVKSAESGRVIKLPL